MGTVCADLCQILYAYNAMYNVWDKDMHVFKLLLHSTVYDQTTQKPVWLKCIGFIKGSFHTFWFCQIENASLFKYRPPPTSEHHGVDVISTW